MGTQVQSQASISGLRIWCFRELWELPHASGMALKGKKEKRKKKKKVSACWCSFPLTLIFLRGDLVYCLHCCSPPVPSDGSSRPLLNNSFKHQVVSGHPSGAITLICPKLDYGSNPFIFSTTIHYLPQQTHTHTHTHILPSLKILIPGLNSSSFLHPIPKSHLVLPS